MNYRQQLKQIKALVFDVDGVFSKFMLLDPDGRLLRTMNPKDGLAIKIAVQQGFKIAIISGAKEPSIRKRFQMLNVQDIYLGKTEEKLLAFEEFLSKYKFSTEQVLYMGDDITDYFVMQKAGFGACPADAAPEIKGIADYISQLPAAEGCVRDIVEQVLRVQNKWEKFLDHLQQVYQSKKAL